MYIAAARNALYARQGRASANHYAAETRALFARLDLARASELQSSAVSAIVEQLIEERWIVEGGTVRLPRGRHPTQLSLNSDIVILAVVDRAIVAVVDLNSRLLSQETILLSSDPKRTVEGLIASLQRMSNSTRINRSRELV